MNTYILVHGAWHGAPPSPLLRQNMVLASDKTCSSVRPEALKEVFYDDCPSEDIDLARSRLCPEPSIPSVTPVVLTEENFGRIPKIYIETLQDKTLLPWFQEKMYNSISFQKVIKINTSHSPFFSAPDELVVHLLSL